MDTLRQSASEGVLWSGASQVARQVVQLGITLVLVRFIAPDDFGLVGMVAVSLSSVAPLNELGLGAALVQRPDVSPGQVRAVFWLQSAAGVALAVLLLAAAPLVAAFFGRDDLVPLLRWMSLGLPFAAAVAAPQALLTRRLQFDRLAGIEAAALVVSGALAVALAVTGWGAWALVAQSLAGAVVTMVLMTAAARFNPLASDGRPRFGELRGLFRFGAPLTAYQFLNFASRNIDDILIGKFLGAHALGLYGVAYRVMTYPLNKVSGVVGRVAFPAFSLMQDDLPRLRRTYLAAVQYIALLTFPMMAAVTVLAPELTITFFGARWAPVAPVMAVLALAGMAQSTGTTVGSVFLARGATPTMLRWEAVASVTYVVAIAGGLPWGLLGVAVCYTAAGLALWPVSHAIANRLIGLPMREFFGALVAPASLAAVTAAALVALRLAWSPAPGTPQPLFLATAAALGAALFLGAARLRAPAAAADLLRLALDAARGAAGFRRAGIR